MFVTLEENGIKLEHDTEDDTIFVEIEGQCSKPMKTKDFINSMYKMINALEGLEQQ